MGFFSFDCPVCNRSIRSHHATNRVSAWMTQCVFLPEDLRRKRAIGEYDGYGRIGVLVDIGDADWHFDHDKDGHRLEPRFALYHLACWRLAGKPAFTEASRSASDQGFFVGEDDPAEPKTLKQCRALHPVEADAS
jgi:hypothetical protein